MDTTSNRPPDPPAPAAASVADPAAGGVVDPRDLDREGVLEAVVAARKAADREEARLLALAVHWVALPPVDESPTGSTAGSESGSPPAMFAAAPPVGGGRGLAPSMFALPPLAG